MLAKFLLNKIYIILFVNLVLFGYELCAMHHALKLHDRAFYNLPNRAQRSFSLSRRCDHREQGSLICPIGAKKVVFYDKSHNYFEELFEKSAVSIPANIELIRYAISNKDQDLARFALSHFDDSHRENIIQHIERFLELALENELWDFAYDLIGKGNVPINKYLIKYASDADIRQFLVKIMHEPWKE